MKLNATSEMIPVTWAEFGNIHPFAPKSQTQGYQILFEQLEEWLAEITGFAGISLQPNAGSQGEYTGLLVIREYHESRKEQHRNVCLIPTSAHGTNPASAVMCGMKVVAVACDSEGNVDLNDLKAKAEKHSNQLAALMVTYPSTHGVFEEQIRGNLRCCTLSRWTSLHGWGKYECPSWSLSSGRFWCRCLSLEFAQNFLYSSRWWWSGYGTNWGCFSFGAFSTRTRCGGNARR
jgi:hypothetical protein